MNRIWCNIRNFACVLIAVLLLSCEGEVDNWKTIETHEGVLILEGTDSVLFYQRTPTAAVGRSSRANYIHPLYGINGGVLTEDFPDDHYHHRGVFWAWHQVFVGDKRMGDAWETTNFDWNVTNVSVERKGDVSVLSANVNWESLKWLDGLGAKWPFAKEEIKIKIHKKKDNFRVLDFNIKIEALEDSLSIGGSEDEKGYSGFSWRMKMPDDLVFNSEGGEVEPIKTEVNAGAWMNISGNLNNKGKEGIIVISHESNPKHPQPWILRKKKSMQNAKFPGNERYEIPKDQPLVLNYRMIIYDGDIEESVIKEMQNF